MAFRPGDLVRYWKPRACGDGNFYPTSGVVRAVEDDTVTVAVNTGWARDGKWHYINVTVPADTVELIKR